MGRLFPLPDEHCISWAHKSELGPTYLKVKSNFRLRERGKGTGERGKGYLSQGNKGVPLDRDETDIAHRQMAFYKGNKGTPCSDEVFNFNWVC